MAIHNRVVGATRKSASFAEVEKALRNWFYKKVLTEDRKSKQVDYDFMSFPEWQAHMFERLKLAGDPTRITIDLRYLGYAVEDALKVDIRFSEDDERNGKLFGAFELLLKPLGWYVAGKSGNTLVFDPVRAPEVTGLRKLYHFSPAWNKDRLIRKGILPMKATDKYGDDYKYPARVHLLTKYDIDKIRELAYHIFNHGTDIETMYRGAPGMNVPLVVFEVDVAKCRPGTRFYTDISVKDAVFTYTHVPPQALKIKHEDEMPTDDDGKPF